ncbi:MAG TPA: hypothetical protein VMR41_05165 [Patescibacteria group bacterium]|nr:hypothetical protein [Patescibacteria group bacterium]
MKLYLDGRVTGVHEYTGKTGNSGKQIGILEKGAIDTMKFSLEKTAVLPKEIFDKDGKIEVDLAAGFYEGRMFLRVLKVSVS